MKTQFKFIFKNVSFLLVLLISGPFNAQVLPEKKVIVIDPGHGGLDPGGVGRYGQEKTITLDVAQALLQWNQLLFEEQFEFHLTREGDTLIPLSQRSQLAKAFQADAFISIHCNSASTKAKGFEVFVPRTHSRYRNHSSLLAACILKEFTDQLGFVSRGIKFADFQVLKQSTLYYPAILIELGFISNGDEGLYFSHQKHINAMALAILIGLTTYLNL